MKYKAIGFDMDGTLIHSVINYDKLANVEVDVLSELGVPSKLLVGGTESETVMRARDYLKSKGDTRTYEELCAIINKRAGEIEMESLDLASAFPGVPEMLGSLKKDYRIGLLTRGQRAYAEKAMGMFDLMKYMDAVQAYDDHPFGEQKPNPIALEYLGRDLGVRPKDILYVGDSPVDYFCARDAGSDFIAIANGERGRATWSRFEGITVVDRVTQVMGYL